MSAAGKSLVAGYLRKLAEITAPEKFTGSFAYRGQENAGWPLESSAYRRLKNSGGDRDNKRQFILYHTKQILESARINGYGVKDGQKLSDLELLAELQHFGAATCLMDFTRDFLVALWFACQIHQNKNGKVFILDTNNLESFRSLEQRDLEHEDGIESILNFQTRKPEHNFDERTPSGQEPRYWHWSPHGMNQRILKQNSLFVFGKPAVDNGHLTGEILIRHNDKGEMLKELGTLGVTQESLFKDMPGFATSHGHGQSISPIYESAKDYLRAGHAAYQGGNIEGAINFYNKAIDIESDNATAYYSRGLAKRSLGDNQGAVDDYTTAAEIRPRYAKAYNNRGFAKQIMGDNQGAVADHTKAIEIQSDYANAYNNRGFAKRALGDNQGAVADHTKAIEIQPDYANAYNNRGVAKNALGDSQGAVADHTKAIEIQPDYANAYNNRGFAKRALGDNQGAVADHTKAIEIQPDYANAYNNRGFAKRALGDNQGAVADYTKAIEIQPDYANAYNNRGFAKRALGDSQGAVADHTKAIEIQPDYVNAYNNRGFAKRALGDNEGAARDFAKAIELGSGDA